MNPSSTCAAKTVAKVNIELNGTNTGMSFRVPTPDVSVVDLTCRLSTPLKKENIHRATTTAAAGAMEHILFHTTGEAVYTDFTSSACSSVHDETACIGVNDNFVRLSVEIQLVRRTSSRTRISQGSAPPWPAGPPTASLTCRSSVTGARVC